MRQRYDTSASKCGIAMWIFAALAFVLMLALLPLAGCSYERRIETKPSQPTAVADGKPLPSCEVVKENLAVMARQKRERDSEMDRLSTVTRKMTIREAMTGRVLYDGTIHGLLQMQASRTESGAEVWLWKDAAGRSHARVWPKGTSVVASLDEPNCSCGDGCPGGCDCGCK